MAGSRAKTAKQKQAKMSSQAVSPREVRANDVMEDLRRLFDRLGINISHPATIKFGVTELGSAAHTLYPYASAIGELLTCWHQDPDYLDYQGNPAPIKSRGSRPSFRSLAQRAVPSIDESYLLSELERLGVVTIDGDKLIRVTTRSFPIYKDKRLAAQHTLMALRDFIRTLDHNIDTAGSSSEQLFHRIAWNGNFDARKIAALKIKLKRQGQNFLESFDNWLIGSSVVKPRSKGNRATINSAEVSIGVYLSIRQS